MTRQVMNDPDRLYVEESDSSDIETMNDRTIVSQLINLTNRIEQLNGRATELELNSRRKEAELQAKVDRLQIKIERLEESNRFKLFTHLIIFILAIFVAFFLVSLGNNNTQQERVDYLENRRQVNLLYEEIDTINWNIKKMGERVSYLESTNFIGHVISIIRNKFFSRLGLN